jgi:hypothetical protein
MGLPRQDSYDMPLPKVQWVEGTLVVNCGSVMITPSHPLLLFWSPLMGRLVNILPLFFCVFYSQVPRLVFRVEVSETVPQKAYDALSSTPHGQTVSEKNVF